MGEVIVITSGKGGVGKTIATANIGVGLANLGKKVIIVDTDLGLRNLDVVLGMENKVIYNLVDVINGHCKKKDALIQDKRFPNLFLIPSSWTKDKSAVSPEQMKKLVKELCVEYDYVLLDCPTGIEQGFQNAIAGAHSAVIVTTPELSAVRNSDRILKLLESNGITKIDLIINRIRMNMIKNGDMMSIDEVIDILPISLLGIIPEDEQVIQSASHGVPVINKESKAGQAYINICKRIMGEEVPFLDLKIEDNFLSKITHVFKRK
ncbi:MAG: septum site-determining protein MinD [Lachnospiraceae bacterium]|nr:septum site-determining protein MinD [Lachnospiraceae bacterium]